MFLRSRSQGPNIRAQPGVPTAPTAQAAQAAPIVRRRRLIQEEVDSDDDIAVGSTPAPPRWPARATAGLSFSKPTEALFLEPTEAPCSAPEEPCSAPARAQCSTSIETSCSTSTNLVYSLTPEQPMPTPTPMWATN